MSGKPLKIEVKVCGICGMPLITILDEDKEFLDHVFESHRQILEKKVDELFLKTYLDYLENPSPGEQLSNS
jgi:hypothetical protein